MTESVCKYSQIYTNMEPQRNYFTLELVDISDYMRIAVLSCAWKIVNGVYFHFASHKKLSVGFLKQALS